MLKNPLFRRQPSPNDAARFRVYSCREAGVFARFFPASPRQRDRLIPIIQQITREIDHWEPHSMVDFTEGSNIMKLDSSTSPGAEDGEMSANILLIEYEPRYVERVQKALEGSSFRLEIAGDLDAAVACCATYEPQTVVITSVLPRIKIEDAITQLRARAGLRSTPFLILMSGYRGSDPAEDAGRYGAQDILARPFSGEAFVAKVEGLLARSEDPATTQAIPSDMLQALRESGGPGGSGPSLTSDDLFGDILSDVEDGGVSAARQSAGRSAAPKKSRVERGRRPDARHDRDRPTVWNRRRPRERRPGWPNRSAHQTGDRSHRDRRRRHSVADSCRARHPTGP